MYTGSVYADYRKFACCLPEVSMLFTGNVHAVYWKPNLFTGSDLPSAPVVKTLVPSSWRHGSNHIFWSWSTFGLEIFSLLSISSPKGPKIFWGGGGVVLVSVGGILRAYRSFRIQLTFSYRIVMDR